VNFCVDALQPVHSMMRYFKEKGGVRFSVVQGLRKVLGFEQPLVLLLLSSCMMQTVRVLCPTSHRLTKKERSTTREERQAKESLR
jgi:hypothetical protein